MKNAECFSVRRVKTMQGKRDTAQRIYSLCLYYYSCKFSSYLYFRRRWVDNIKIDLREVRWNGVDWIELAQDRDQWRALVNTVMKLRVP
jgi:hypothetical protein